MKTTKFFNVAAILFTVAPSFFATSCIDEYKEDPESGYYSIYNQKEVQKTLETSVEIGDNIDSFYDLKAKYVYDGVAVEESLVDLNEYEQARVISQIDDDVKTVRFKKYGLSKKFNNVPVSVTITATPKADAIARAQAMPDDAVFTYRLDSKTRVDGKIDFSDNYNWIKSRNIMNKADFIEALQQGVRIMELRDF